MARVRNCCFTAYKFGDDWKKYINDAYEKKKCKYMIAQLEQCPKTSKLHIQGYCEFDKKVSIKTVKLMFDDDSIHVEKRMGSQEQAINYCKKSDSSIESAVEFGTKNAQGKRSDLLNLYEMIKNGDSLDDIIDAHPGNCIRYLNNITKIYNRCKQSKHKVMFDNKYKDKDLRSWQQDCLKVIENQNDRQITWIYDDTGNTGKSWFGNWLRTNKNAFKAKHGKAADIAYRYNYEPIICFDFSRHCAEMINYDMIETMKNGEIFSNKYESCEKLVCDPKIVIMSNSLPDLTKWSRDRYDIYNIDDEALNKLNYDALRAEDLENFTDYAYGN